MARIKTVSLVAGISGRTCQVDDTYFATNTQTGKVYAVKRCNPYEGEPSEAQKAVRTAFTTRSKVTKAWMAANKPSTTNAKGTDEYQAMLKLYKSQHKIGNTFAFVSSKIVDGAVPSFLAAADTSSSENAGGASGTGGTDLDA